MALNPFFLHGTSSEQFLVQDLINEHIRMFGMEVTYIPRKMIDTDDVFNEVQSSKFDDNFILEAYLNNYEGHTGQGDLMTKFGISLRDEITLTISKERFEDFISPFLIGRLDGIESDASYDDGATVKMSSRPKEGDLIYFPLSSRLFEIKFVEHESPFYQLNKNYTYELKCELFEYEDEIIDTNITDIDELLDDQGYLVDLTLVSAGTTATATANIGTGYIREIFLNNDGYNYTSVPTVAISTSPDGGTSASAVATLKTVSGSKTIDQILLINAGTGYTVAPTITISGGGGTGAAATCSVGIGSTGVVSLSITDFGSGYITEPTVTIAGPGSGTTATANSVLYSGNIPPRFNTVDSFRIVNPGIGYTEAPTVTISDPSVLSGIGTFKLGEKITGGTSGAIGRVKNWNRDDLILRVGNVSGTFTDGEVVTGAESGAVYAFKSSAENETINDKYQDNLDIESVADSILDFTESNPFGTY
jgi:hypothetical protein